MLIEFESSDHNSKVLMRGVILRDSVSLLELDNDLQFYRWPEFAKNSTRFRYNSGVCDGLVNVLEVFPELLDESHNCRKFILMLTPLKSTDFCGYFSYIGTKFVNVDGIYMNITHVFKYAIYEKIC